MKLKLNTRYKTISIYTVIVFAVCLLMTRIVFQSEEIFAVFGTILSVLSPIIWGIAIAYLLNPIVKVCEKLFSKIINRKKEHPKGIRALSILLTSLLTLALISALIAMVVPQVLESIKTLFVSFPTYLNNLQDYVNQFLSKNPNINDILASEFENVQTYLLNIVSQLQPKLDLFITSLKDGAFSFLSGLKDFFLGFIVSIYLIYSKEIFIAQTKKTIYAIFPVKTTKKILSVAHNANSTFISFLTGKALDSLIIGIISFIVLTYMKMPYVVLISCLIGITNMIPFFGPFIGAVPSALLVLLSTPNKLIWFLIFIFLLQQFDGNFLGPKILGNSLGLSAFWIMFAIFLGGGLFGFIGMIAFVPLFAVFYTLFKTFVEDKLSVKNLPISSSAYYESDIDKIHNDDESSENVEIIQTDELEESKKVNSNPSSAKQEEKSTFDRFVNYIKNYNIKKK